MLTTPRDFLCGVDIAHLLTDINFRCIYKRVLPGLLQSGAEIDNTDGCRLEIKITLKTEDLIMSYSNEVTQI